MKTILLTLIIFTHLSMGQSFSIQNQSFNTSDSIGLGSAQWVDVKNEGGTYNSSTRTRLFIYHVTESGQLTDLTEIFNVNFYNWYFSAPFNSDGITKRIQFTMPASFPLGTFKIGTLSYNWVFGELKNPVTTSILKPIFPGTVENPVYFNLHGQKIDNPVTGFYIKYTGIKAEKVFFE